MSLVTQINDVVVDIATEIKADRVKIGDLASLATTIKTSLVAALNEIADEIAEGGGAVIDDTAPSTTKVYSSSKTEAVAAAAAAAIIDDASAAVDSAYSSQKVTDLIAAAIDNLVNGASSAMDTLKELADAIAGDETDISDIMTALGNRVRFDDEQTLTGPQKTQACANIGAVQTSDMGDPATDFAATFAAALA